MERGPRYEVYAQLRESNLRYKRLKLYEFDPISEIPYSELSPPVKKPDEFHDDLGDFEDGYRVSGLPKPGFMKKPVKLQGISEHIEENEQVCEIPKSEYSPIIKKPLKHRRISGNFEENVRASGIPKPYFLRKSVNFYPEIPKSEISPILKKKSMNVPPKTEKKQRFSALAQSVPNFASALRKENQKPTMVSVNMKNTSPLGSKSTRGGRVNAGEKQSSSVKGIVGRKSYACIEDLKGVSNGDNKRGRSTRKSTLFSTNYY